MSRREALPRLTSTASITPRRPNPIVSDGRPTVTGRRDLPSSYVTSSSSSFSVSDMPFSASQSHVANAAYMNEFYRGLAEMEESSTCTSRPLPVSGALAVTSSRTSLPRQMPSNSSTGPSPMPAAPVAQARLLTLPDSLSVAHWCDHRTILKEPWWRSPVQPSGDMFDVSDRPLMCVSSTSSAGDVVFGGADHALYVVKTAVSDSRGSVASRRGEGASSLSSSTGSTNVRRLHSKDHGHREWVSSVAQTASGAVLSGGLDGRVCYWPQGSHACIELSDGSGGGVATGSTSGRTRMPSSSSSAPRSTSSASEVKVTGHKASVSKVLCDRSAHMACSSDYDGRILIWSLPSSSASSSSSSRRSGPSSSLSSSSSSSSSSRSSLLQALVGHDAPVLDFTYQGSGGHVGDAATTDMSSRDVYDAVDGCIEASRPPSSASSSSLSSRLASVSRDGYLFVWDIAAGKTVKKYRAHRGHATAVIAPSASERSPSSSSLHVWATGGQDGCVRMWDTRTARCSLTADAHSGGAGGGAVGGLLWWNNVMGGARGGGADPLSGSIISYGADGCVCVMDVRSGLRVVERITSRHRDFIYSMCLVENCPTSSVSFHSLGERETGDDENDYLSSSSSAALFTGGGDGMVLCYRLGSDSAGGGSTSVRGGVSRESAATGGGGRLCYGMQACSQGAVRCMSVTVRSDGGGMLCVGNEQGHALVYRY